jgi:hypothetical protein
VCAIKNINSLKREPTPLRNSRTEGGREEILHGANLGHAHSSVDTSQN